MTMEHRHSASPAPLRARLRFERLPSTYGHPERLARLLPGGLSAGLRHRLQGSARLAPRLSAYLALPPCTADQRDTPEYHFASLEGEALQHALHRIGAIWHGHILRKIVLAKGLRGLIERLGRDGYRAALDVIDLAPEEAADADQSFDADSLMNRIERDALIAVNAWCRRQPAALVERLKLKLPPCSETDDQPSARYLQHGPAIVDHVVTTLWADAQQGDQ